MTVAETTDTRYGLSLFPDFTARTLVKALRDQGFAVEDGGNELAITPPGSDKVYTTHHSVVGRAARNSGKNMLNDLVNLGFIPPDVWAKQQKEAEKTLECEVEGCGRRFRLPLHLGRHQTSVHGIESKTSHAPKIEKPAAPKMSANGRPAASPLKVRFQEPTDDRLRVRSPAAKLAAALEVASEAATKLLELYDAQHVELEELKTRMRKVEQRMGKVVEAL